MDTIIFEHNFKFMKRILIGFLAIALLVLLTLSVLFWISFSDRSSYQSGLPNFEGLPQTASDITIYQNKNISGTLVADFKISESNFVSFAKEKSWVVQPIKNVEYIFQAKAFHEGKFNDKLEIADGLYYSKRAENGGGITVAYDRKSGRGYIESSNR